MTNVVPERATAARTRSTRQVREREILRISAEFSNYSGQEKLMQARREVLIWAQRRSGGKLPEEAWTGAGFELLSGGRTTLGVSIDEGDVALWSLRADDPDKSVPGRIWTTEITIGKLANSNPKLSIRSLASSAEEVLLIYPHVPGFMQQILKKCSLQTGGVPITKECWHINSTDDVESLCSHLVNKDRNRPIFVVTGDDRELDANKSFIDLKTLTVSTLGIAHVAFVPAHLTYALSDIVGRRRSVFHGGVRAYMPGFDLGSTSFQHPLFVSDELKNQNSARECVNMLRSIAARESIKRSKLNIDVLTFASIRSAFFRIDRNVKNNTNAPDADKLVSAQAQIAALEDELAKAKEWEVQLSKLHDDAENRSSNAEAQLQGSIVQIQYYQELAEQEGRSPEMDTPDPGSWIDITDWIDEKFIGRVAIAPSARRGIKKAEFTDIALINRCIKWLATECRNRRMAGGGSLSEHYLEEGIRNSSCGGDTYKFSYQERSLVADWHIKNGGNTRDPSRCLRIYYGWDEVSKQIIISDMPSHLSTGAS